MVKAKGSGVTGGAPKGKFFVKEGKRNPLRSRYPSNSSSNLKKLRGFEAESTVVLTTPEEFALYDDLKKQMDAEMIRRGMRKPETSH